MAATLAAGLVVALLLAVLFMSPGFQLALEDFLNEDLAPCLQGQGACQGTPGGNPPAGQIGVPVISERYFDTGTTHASVTGALSLAGDIAIDPVASYVSNTGRAWIAFGSDFNSLLVLVTFHEPEDTVTVTQGVLRATGMDTQCTFNVTVTETLIAGHISCPSIDAFDADEKVGTASIELDFSAASPPGGGDGGDPDYDEGDPDQ